MKKILTILLVVATVLSVSAKPKLIGHRGSYWGVENTKEAFINGAKKGYHCLETDIKVTLDGKFICWHNDVIEADQFGFTKKCTINEHSLKWLQTQTLTQTRGGVTYTGTFCSFEEYLDICKEYNVTPVIELKWADGVNSNDQSNIPALMQIVIDKGFRNNCFIFTSMKNCLTYLKKNYPDVEIMLLVYDTSFDSSLDWCKTNGCHIGPGVGDGITQAGVQAYHDAGLLVNAWSCNTNSAYSTYAGYGCDYITTDYLDPTTLPDVSVEDPSDIKIEVIWENSTALGNAPENIDGTYALQGGGYNQTLYVHNHKDKKLYLFDSSGCLGSIPGADGRGCAIDEAGNIILRADTLNETAHKFMVYPSGATVSNPGTPINIDVEVLASGASMVFSASGDVLGDGGYIYTYPSGSTTVNVIKVVNGKVKEVTQSSTLSLIGTAEGYVIPKNNDPKNWIYQVRANGYYTYANGTSSALMADSYSTTAPARNTTIGGAYVELGGKEVFLYNSGAHYKGGFCVKDLTKGVLAATITPIGTLGYVDGGNQTCANWLNIQRIDDYNCYVYQYCPANGMAVYKMYDSSYKPEVSSDVEFVFETVWEKSTTLGNAPSNIDGTNAQQGSAHNGKFYVNNKEEGKLHIFTDEAEYTGSIAGGKGWGCDCDDAGNVVIRNDAETTANHSFIIYPAGATVANPGTAISVDVTLPLEGQANFISASGNVLGKEGGYIYVYPNGQTAVCVVTMVEGKATAVNSYTGLSLTGSTAGYVIPMENNPQKWIYQVRSGGYYTYNTGTNTALMAGSSSTTQPARNSSVGGEYFKLCDHEIFIHSSGANYKGGFTVRDLTTEEVIANVEPIGNLGYQTGGNYSVANWVRAEAIDNNSCYIYQYCPANGMAKYKLYNKNAPTGVDKIVIEDKTTLRVAPNPVVDVVSITSSEDITVLELYNYVGAMVDVEMSVDDNVATLNMGSLPAGIYIVRVNDGSAKIIKK